MTHKFISVHQKKIIMTAKYSLADEKGKQSCDISAFKFRL